MNTTEFISQIQETTGKLRAVLAAIDDMMIGNIDFKANNTCAAHLPYLVSVACEYAEKIDTELERLEREENGLAA